MITVITSLMSYWTSTCKGKNVVKVPHSGDLGEEFEFQVAQLVFLPLFSVGELDIWTCYLPSKFRKWCFSNASI